MYARASSDHCSTGIGTIKRSRSSRLIVVVVVLFLCFRCRVEKENKYRSNIYTRIYYYDCYQINSIFYDDICVVYACLKTVSRRVVFFVEYGLDMATADVDAAIS